MDDDLSFGPPYAPPLVHDPASLRVAIAEQRGLVTTQQCLRGGMSDGAIRHRHAVGRWAVVRHRVYQTVPGQTGWWWEATSALLSVGAGAAWAFETAAFADGLLRDPPRQITLMVHATINVRAPAGVTVVRSRHADERIDPLRWPWRTTVEDTILDVAEKATVDGISAMLGRAFQRPLTTQEALLARLAARSRHRQRRLLVDLLDTVADGAESAMEVRFVRDVERPHGLPRGRRQLSTTTRGLRLHDVGYDRERVLVELDGRLGHTDEGRVHDGVRDRRSAGLGWLTVRAFWGDVAGSPCTLAAEIGEVLMTRGWTGRLRRCGRPACVIPSSA